MTAADGGREFPRHRDPEDLAPEQRQWTATEAMDRAVRALAAHHRRRERREARREARGER